MADYDDLMEIMKNMRAMRRLHPDPVPDELIRKILQAGSCAPNGGNTQRWRFLVIKDTKIKQAVQVWYKKAFDEGGGPRSLKSPPPPGVTRSAAAGPRWSTRNRRTLMCWCWTRSAATPSRCTCLRWRRSSCMTGTWPKTA